jgi:peptide-methionine (R)-S-oxide reductase
MWKNDICCYSFIVNHLTGVIMNRRTSLLHLFGIGTGLSMGSAANSAETKPALLKSHAEWKKILPASNYAVLFEEDTERPHSSPLNLEKRIGTFVCFACNNPMFKSQFKYDSGTGWPSFFDALPKAVGKKIDKRLFATRTEYHCSHCGGHHGHVFDDGPKPTGLRYCNNGLSLKFIPVNEKLPELRT